MLLFYGSPEVQPRRILMYCSSSDTPDVVFSLLSVYLGANWYGYGLAASLLLTVAVGLYWLDRKMTILEYETFMLA